MPRITKDNTLTNYISREEIARISHSIDSSVTRSKALYFRQNILNALATGISDADLERISKTFPAILTEAVRELNGEVEYIQHNLTV